MNGQVGEWLPLQPQWQHWGELELTNASASPVVLREDTGVAKTLEEVTLEERVVVEVLEDCIVEGCRTGWFLGSHTVETAWLLTVFDVPSGRQGGGFDLLREPKSSWYQ